MNMKLAAISILLSISSASFAQAEQEPLSLEAVPVGQPRAALPANTEVLLAVNQEISTKGRQWNEGDTFGLSVVHDVTYGDYVVIPRGSRAVGRITWLTSKGAFGKSGKMDIELLYIEVAGRRIDVDGTFRQEGEGNTVATVGGVLVAGVFAGFITGKSARIPQGRELIAHTALDVPLALPTQAAAIPAGLPLNAPVAVASSRSAGEAAARWANGE